jgi:hypothetical protein
MVGFDPFGIAAFSVWEKGAEKGLVLLAEGLAFGRLIEIVVEMNEGLFVDRMGHYPLDGSDVEQESENRPVQVYW